jgi:hypothetical protein
MTAPDAAADRADIAPPDAHRPNWGRAVARSLAIVLLGLAAFRLAVVLNDPFGQRFLANDLNGYLEGARRFLETGSPYLPEQLSGTWQLQPDSFIHPPVALLLFVPFTVLPPLAWWALPIGLTAWSVVRLRPASWAWPLMALGLLWPRTTGILIAGNTDMWVAAALAITLSASVPATVLLVMKPSYAPLFFVGARWRSWWIAAVAAGMTCLLFGGLWLDYLTVIRGVTIDPSYSILNLPYVAIPFVAWLGRTVQPPRREPIRLPTALRRRLRPNG